MTHVKTYILGKIFFLLFGFFLLQLVLGVFLLNQISLNQIKSSLQTLANRIHSDISYRNGTWDTTRYNADPNVPASSTVYIFAADGFVIDRWKPIHGFLDTSDVKHLLTYNTPQTIMTSTQQSWRVLSQAIAKNGQTLGVITVASFNPPIDQLTQLDTRLSQALNLLQAKTHIDGNTINIQGIDSRDIPYDISFQIVDRFNKILTKNNNTNSIDRIPNFIDVSYIGNLLNNPSLQQVNDAITNERYVFFTSPVVVNNEVVAVIVVGRSIAYLASLLQNFILLELILGVLFVVFGTFIFYKVFQPLFPQKKIAKEAISSISFNKKESVLRVDATEISIPFATNQYYLCDALFSNPRKRFETDELLEKFGDIDLTSGRKVYDAMITVNKKTQPLLGTRLIIARDKTYQINPLFLPLIP